MTFLLTKEPLERVEKSLVEVLGLIQKIPVFLNLVLGDEPVTVSDLTQLSRFCTFKKYKAGE
jgi:hypothetical protein